MVISAAVMRPFARLTSMKRQRNILVCSAVLLVAVVGVFALSPGEKEPEYQGKRLNWWIERFSDSPKEAGNAVRSIGKDAIPSLLAWIHEARRQEIAREFPDWVQNNPAVKKWGHLDSCRARLGEKGFRILGPGALPALPQLTQLLRKSNSGVCAKYAADSLTYLGKDGLPPMLEILQDRKQPYEKRVAVASAFWNIGYLGSNAVAAVPVLISCAAETNSLIRREVDTALLYLFEAETPSIESVDPSDWAYKMATPDSVLRWVVFENAVRYHMKTNAQWARIVLIGALSSQDERMRAEARNIFGFPSESATR